MIITTRKQLFFASLENRGWQPEPQPSELRPLWQTIHHAIATIKCARLTHLPLHRRLGCLIAFAPGRYYLTAAIIGAIVFGAHFYVPPLQPVFAASTKNCPTLGGKPICDLSESAKKASTKKPKADKMACQMTDKVEQIDGCMAPSFYSGMASTGSTPADIEDAKALYGVCKLVIKCKK
jgi:hypothetical protein